MPEQSLLELAENAMRGLVPPPPQTWQRDMNPGDHAVFVTPDGAWGFAKLIEPSGPMHNDFAYIKAWVPPDLEDHPVVLHRSLLSYPLTAQRFQMALAIEFKAVPKSLGTIVGFSQGGDA